MKRFWLFKRWLTFNGVGVMGVLVQLGTLALLVHGFGIHYLAATLIAVESAVLHNFYWHQRWTWRDRPAASAAETAKRLVRFHLLNGMVSMAGNLAIVALLGGILRMDPLVANMIAIVSCSIVNFIASEVLVFNRGASPVGLPDSLSRTPLRRRAPFAWLARHARSHVVVVGLLLAPAPARAADVGTAELTQAAIAAWQQYERQVDARYDRAAAERDMFFIQDLYKSAGWRQRVQAGQVSMLRVDSITPGGPEPSIGDARIHHWVGAVFIPRASVDGVVRYLRDRAGRESEAFDDVIASKLLARDGDRIRVYMKLKRESVITVTYNTEHSVEYRHLDAARASSRSVATKIAEIADAGTPQEREKTPGNDHGFLWRLNAYWRYQQVDGGVLIECESVSLSRSVPLLLRPFVTGTVERIARESLQKTLVSLRTELVKR